MLLEPELRARLERLALASRRRIRGLWGGSHRSTRLGESLDFADYREYHPGDDFRRIDYNLWARLGVVLVRLFEGEEELPVRVLLDASASMDFGEKFTTARRLAAMVTYLALASGERVQIAVVPEPGNVVRPSPWGRHVGAWPRLESWLESIEAGGGTDLPAAAGYAATPGALRGPVVLVSDLMVDGWEKAVDRLGVAAGGIVLHVLDPAELDPALTGDLTLVDVETGGEVSVSMSRDAEERYREALQTFLDDAARRARRSGLDYLQVPAGIDAPEIVLRGLVEAGVLR